MSGLFSSTVPALEPVVLEVVRECHFKQKPCALCGKAKGHANHTPKKTATCRQASGKVGSWPRGCDRCGRNKGDRAHFGAPPSFNVMASGEGSGNAMVFMNMKQSWQAFFVELLQASGLPRGLERVYVEGEITFPDKRDDRDQGNFRVVIEKALGDALQEGGWLKRDSWDHYEFGQLTKREHPGESATRLMLFPVPPPQATPDIPHTGEQMEIT
jgi:hypothetical protein